MVVDIQVPNQNGSVENGPGSGLLVFILITTAQLLWIFYSQHKTQADQKKNIVCNNAGQPCDGFKATCCWPAICNITGETGPFGLCVERQKSKIRSFFIKVGKKIKKVFESFDSAILDSAEQED